LPKVCPILTFISFSFVFVVVFLSITLKISTLKSHHNISKPRYYKISMTLEAAFEIPRVPPFFHSAPSEPPRRARPPISLPSPAAGWTGGCGHPSHRIVMCVGVHLIPAYLYFRTHSSFLFTTLQDVSGCSFIAPKSDLPNIFIPTRQSHPGRM